MLWTLRGAHAIIALRCGHLDNGFADYWEARRVAGPQLLRRTPTCSGRYVTALWPSPPWNLPVVAEPRL